MVKVSKKGIFWDYDMSKLDLDDPKAKVWYMSRKINFGDFKGLKRKDLTKYLNKLDISRSMRELLGNFLKSKTR